MIFFFFFQAEDGIRDADVTGVQTCALPISMPSQPLSLNVTRRDDVPCLVIAGEIDLATAPAFEAAAVALLDEKPAALILDFGGVRFCDSSGIGVLVRLYNRATVA